MDICPPDRYSVCAWLCWGWRGWVLPTRTVQGTYRARVSVRDTGSFNLKTSTATVEGINHKYCRIIQRGDGYGYHLVSRFQHFIGKQRACFPA
jgi:hypothetical protein